MAVSGSTSWELTRDQIITQALRKVGALDKTQSADSTDITNCAIALNALIALYNTLGMPLWKRQEQSVTLVASTGTYTLTGAVKVPAVYLRNLNSSVQYELENKSEYDIMKLPYSATGVPVSWSFTPNIAEGGTLRIWPLPTSSEATNYQLRVIVQDEFDTFTASGETPDFPAYWTQALIFGLASAISYDYGLPIEDRKELEQKAQRTLAQASSYGDEESSIFLQPNSSHC